MPDTKDEKVKLPIYLASTVARILRDKHGIDHWKTKSGMLDCSFTFEELSKITELSFDSKDGGLRGQCEGVNLLPNLRRLAIKSKQRTEYISPEDVTSIGRKDIESIAKCSSLESLTIENQPDMDYLDVSKLSRLKSFRILHNPKLIQLDGLDKLSQLDSFTCVGNDRLFKIDNLDKIIEAHNALQHLTLDILLFPSAVGYEVKGTTNKNALYKLDKLASRGGMAWAQTVAGSYKAKDAFGYGIVAAERQLCRFNHSEMIQMHNAACQILADNVRPTAFGERAVIEIDNWLAKNVTYTPNYNPQKDMERDHTPFNFLIKKSCVCEGYAKGMQYLLALMGIQSHAVYCIGGRPDIAHVSDSQTELNRHNMPQPDLGRLHCILGLDDVYGYYCDPCWDAGMYQKKGNKNLPYCLLTKQEISQTHTLSLHERDYSYTGAIQSKRRSDITDAIATNELFLKTKSAEVEAQRKQLGQQRTAPVRGMISMGRK